MDERGIKYYCANFLVWKTETPNQMILKVCYGLKVD